MQFIYKLYYEMWKTNKTRYRQLSPYRVLIAETDVFETYAFRHALISSEAHLPDVSRLQNINCGTSRTRNVRAVKQLIYSQPRCLSGHCP